MLVDDKNYLVVFVGKPAGDNVVLSADEIHVRRHFVPHVDGHHGCVIRPRRHCGIHRAEHIRWVELHGKSAVVFFVGRINIQRHVVSVCHSGSIAVEVSPVRVNVVDEVGEVVFLHVNARHGVHQVVHHGV